MLQTYTESLEKFNGEREDATIVLFLIDVLIFVPIPD